MHRSYLHVLPKGEAEGSNSDGWPMGVAPKAVHGLRYLKYKFDTWTDDLSGTVAGGIQYLREEINPGILNLHRRDFNNIGDMECASLRHVNTQKPIYYLDLKNLTGRLLERHPTTPIVIGGGGLFYFAKEINKVTARHKGPVVGWAIGRNRHFNTCGGSVAVDRFALLGVRDWDCGHEWVPCTSCMSPLFDRFRDVSPKHDIVVYEHRSCRLGLNEHPTMDNHCMDLGKVLGFLASGDTVVTNSYHGAYWAKLLGRKLIIIPFSDRLLHFRYPVPIATSDNYLEHLDKTIAYPEALSICRERNIEFAEKVSEVIGVELKFRQPLLQRQTSPSQPISVSP